VGKGVLKKRLYSQKKPKREKGGVLGKKINNEVRKKKPERGHPVERRLEKRTEAWRTRMNSKSVEWVQSK